MLPLTASTSRARASLPDRAITSSSRNVASTPFLALNRTEFCRVYAVAANADEKRRRLWRYRGAKPHVGGNAIEMKRATAVDDNRNFGREPLRKRRSQPARCARSAASAAESEDFLGIEPGERVAEDRQGRRQRRCRARRPHRRKAARMCAQPANLNAAARGDLDDAVAVLLRRRTKLRRMPQARRCRSASAAPAIRRRSASAPKVRDRRRGASACIHDTVSAATPQDRRRHRCGADAKSRGGALHRDGRRSPPRPAGFRAAETRARRRRRHRPRAADRTMRSQPRPSFRQRRRADRRFRQVRRRRAGRAASGRR